MPAHLPGPAALRIKADAENFPVALRLLPRRARTELFAVYGFARLTDEIGDEYPGDRLAALDWIEADLIAAIVGQASHPAVARLTPMLRSHTDSFALFRDLISANRRDQVQTRYETFGDLLDYCTLSANPVGRLVLGVFAVRPDDDVLRWSDDVCSGLQVVEHLQDVAEDHTGGRVYLPQDDLAAFGCTDDDLARPTASPAVRRLVAFEVERARSLLDSGRDLVTCLPVQPRIAIAGFVAGGHAALDAIEAAGHDVLGRRCRPSRRRLARRATPLLVAAESAVTSSLTPAAAYARCARITSTEAKNFAYGIRLLPGAKRDAMSALYACARRIDDIADGDDPVADKLAALAVVDEHVAALAAGELPDATDPVLVGVHDAARSFPIPVMALSEIVEGCRRDCTDTGCATFADTEAYCRLVAGSVGRLSLGVFGHHGGGADPVVLADDLGVALQLTNILRDIVEDRGRGRVYLPADDVRRFGCEPDVSGPPAALVDLVRHYCAVAETYYARGLPLLLRLDRRSRACVAAMAGIYHRLLSTIASDPSAATRERVSLSTPQKLLVAARSLTGLSP